MSQPQTQYTPNPVGLRTYQGSCHCGAVRYEAELDLAKGASRCNCTICQKLGSTGVNLKPSGFRLLKGAESLGEYRVGNSTAHRAFCKHCGVYLFGAGDIPEIGGAFVSVNLNTLDDIEFGALQIGYWDGRHDNWTGGLRQEPWPVRP